MDGGFRCRGRQDTPGRTGGDPHPQARPPLQLLRLAADRQRADQGDLRRHRWQAMIRDAASTPAPSRNWRAARASIIVCEPDFRLTFLAPDLVETVLDGQQVAGLAVENLRKALPIIGSNSDQHSLGREPINSDWSADVCFEAHYGLKPDIAPCPKSARNHEVPQSRANRSSAKHKVTDDDQKHHERGVEG